MRAGAAEPKVREAAEVAVFGAGDLERTGAGGVGPAAGRAAAGVGVAGDVGGEVGGELRFGDAGEALDCGWCCPC